MSGNTMEAFLAAICQGWKDHSGLTCGLCIDFPGCTAREDYEDELAAWTLGPADYSAYMSSGLSLEAFLDRQDREERA